MKINMIDLNSMFPAGICTRCNKCLTKIEIIEHNCIGAGEKRK